MRRLLVVLLSACGRLRVRAEDYTVAFEVQLTSDRRETFLVTVREAKSPVAAQRFRELVTSGFFAGCRFYRVMPGFIAQFGVSGNTTVQRHWDRLPLQEERSIEHKDWNMRGTIAFATSGAGVGSRSSRSTELLINYDDNQRMDSAGVVPFGRVVRGMSVLDAIYSGYRERPQAELIRQRGDAYLWQEFPRLSYIYGAQQVAFVEEPVMLSKNFQGALITVAMVFFAGLVCVGIRLLQRRVAKGYNKTPPPPWHEDADDDDDDEGDEGDDDDTSAVGPGSKLTGRHS